MVSLLLLLDIASKTGEMQNGLFIASAVSFGVFGTSFVAIEAFWAKDPMIPLRLVLERNRGSIFVVQGLFFCAHIDVRSHRTTLHCSDR